jgi:hypothetical protein
MEEIMLLLFYKNKFPGMHMSFSFNKLSLFVVLLVISFTITSCKKADVETPEPIKELIARFENCSCEPYIDLYSWKGQKVYVLAYKGPACNWIPGYFNEEGQPIGMENGYTLQEFVEDSWFLKRVWTCQ